MSMLDVISDNSNKNLNEVPKNILDMYNLQMLYLEGNFIESLPENLFQKLTRLTWLDLRNNKLETIPTGIANHESLETLLLKDNHISVLPTEIGLVPNLKVLQLAGNPITYPPQEYINKGVQVVCQFLKTEYEKSSKQSMDDTKSTTQLSQDGSKIPNSEAQKDETDKRLRSYAFMPAINVKSLQEDASNGKEEQSITKRCKPYGSRKTHKITRNSSKISLRSNYQWNTVKHGINKEAVQNSDLREIWMSKLKILLADQERILQQEKNLQTLNKWRLQKKTEPPRSPPQKVSKPPYDTDPHCNRILSRNDLSAPITKKKPKFMARRTIGNSKIDVQKLIDQVVDQMKNMETQFHEEQSPHIQQQIAASQIESIVELHKRIMSLQMTNATNL